MSTKSSRLLLAAVVVLGTATATFAQQTTGTIAGRVLDEQKAAVPGATITVNNDSTGFSRSEVSDTDGLYRITGLPVGSYALSIDMSGFQAQKRTVQVNVSETVSADFDVRIAQMSESVTVTAESPLVSTNSSAVGGVVDIAPHREPPAERPAVRESRGHDSGCRPRLPRRPDQEHAGLAANQRRQRPQRELPDRRRRQQRRHRRRPAAALPTRGDSGVQLPHLSVTRRSTAAATAA